MEIPKLEKKEIIPDLERFYIENYSHYDFFKAGYNRAIDQALKRDKWIVERLKKIIDIEQYDCSPEDEGWYLNEGVDQLIKEIEGE